MKIVRLIAFIPSALLAMVVVNLIYTLIIKILSYMNNGDVGYLAILIKTATVSMAATITGIYVYPFNKKLIPLLSITILLIFFIFFKYYIISLFGGYIINDVTPAEVGAEIVNSIGFVIGIGYSWYAYYKDEL